MVEDGKRKSQGQGPLLAIPILSFWKQFFFFKEHKPAWAAEGRSVSALSAGSNQVFWLYLFVSFCLHSAPSWTCHVFPSCLDCYPPLFFPIALLQMLVFHCLQSLHSRPSQLTSEYTLHDHCSASNWPIHQLCVLLQVRVCSQSSGAERSQALEPVIGG